MPLTDIAIRSAKPRQKAYKLCDMQGLFVLVQPSGGKLWRMKYRFAGVEKKLGFGTYPQVSLRDARKKRDEARDLIAEGKDPAIERQRDKLRASALAENTFTSIAAEYCRKRRRDGDRAWAVATAMRCEYLLSLLDTSIGRMPIHEIEPIDALAAIRKIEKRGKLESARRTLQLASAVFRYAVATARLKSDPTRDLRGALTTPTVTHYGAVTDSAEVGNLLRSIDGYEGQGMTKWALQLAPHVFVRPGELRHARWDEIDLEAAVWIIPAEKMKMRKPHHVPLSRQSIAILNEIRSITGAAGYVFPSMRSRARPMSENTLNAAHRKQRRVSNQSACRYVGPMAKGIFMHRSDSIYDDSPAVQYQFPKQYLGRVSACIGDWIIYLEPGKVRGSRGYFATAKVEQVVPDPTAPDMYLALIEPGTYLDFVNHVPFNGATGIVERGVLNDAGRISGRAQSAVRPLSIADFNRIIDLGTAENDDFLPRVDSDAGNSFRQERVPFQHEIERDRVAFLASRMVRDRLFRRRIVTAYDARCAVTGLKLINGGGRAEVEAAHIRPVEHGGPDIVSNGIALSGTVHWMFDRGLISLKDDLEIMISRQANDLASIRSLVNRTGFAVAPSRTMDRPHPGFLAWHRDNCFKH